MLLGTSPTIGLRSRYKVNEPNNTSELNFVDEIATIKKESLTVYDLSQIAI